MRHLRGTPSPPGGNSPLGRLSAFCARLSGPLPKESSTPYLLQSPRFGPRANPGPPCFPTQTYGSKHGQQRLASLDCSALPLPPNQPPFPITANPSNSGADTAGHLPNLSPRPPPPPHVLESPRLLLNGEPLASSSLLRKVGTVSAFFPALLPCCPGASRSLLAEPRTHRTPTPLISADIHLEL